MRAVADGAADFAHVDVEGSAEGDLAPGCEGDVAVEGAMVADLSDDRIGFLAAALAQRADGVRALLGCVGFGPARFGAQGAGGDCARFLAPKVDFVGALVFGFVGLVGAGLIVAAQNPGAVVHFGAPALEGPGSVALDADGALPSAHDGGGLFVVFPHPSGGEHGAGGECEGLEARQAQRFFGCVGAMFVRCALVGSGARVGKRSFDVGEGHVRSLVYCCWNILAPSGVEGKRPREQLVAGRSCCGSASL